MHLHEQKPPTSLWSSPFRSRRLRPPLLFFSVDVKTERGGEGRRMAAVPCSKCTAERKGFRRELDSWRCKLIHCVGFESILEGIYGSMLTRDLNLFDDCEPEEVVDWSPEANCSHCSFCNLPLEKDPAPATTSPLSSPSDFSPCQAATISENNHTAHKFLQAVFHKKDVSPRCDASIPRIAEELMKKMIHQFAMEYASKCLLHTNSMDVTTRISSPLSETLDAPLDLTINRTPGVIEKESDAADGVLDLSKKNAASSTTSSNVKASGCPSTLDKEELEDLEQRRRHPQSALYIVLSSLCSAHCSLLYQMLKLAHKEKCLSPPAHEHIPTETHGCHCGLCADDDALNECEARSIHSFNSSSPNCGYQDGGSTAGHTRDLPFKGYEGVVPLDLNDSCMQNCRIHTCTQICPKKLHCPPSDPINNLMCSFGPCSSIRCNQQHRSYSCVTNHTCVTHLKKTTGGCEPPPPVLNREQSLSPPPLSPISSDIDKLNDEMPPSLLHHNQDEEAAHMVKDLPGTRQEVAVDAAKTVERVQSLTPRNSQAKKNPNVTSLQDVVNRFSEKLDTIKPPEKDLSLLSSPIDASEQKQLDSPTGQNLKFPADALLTEIITTVLHTRSASDYNLSELFNRHDNKDPKSPNTRLRRRQEVLAALATPADGATMRRQSLQIKRELAMFNMPYNRRKSSQAKSSPLKDGHGAVNTGSTLLDSNVMPEEERETGLKMDYQRVTGVLLNIITPESNMNEVKDDGTKEREMSTEEIDPKQTMSHDLQTKLCSHCSQDDNEQSQVRNCQTDKVSALSAIILENAPSGEGCGTDECDSGPVEDQNHASITDSQQGQKPPSNESRKSRRNIVPPQRFSSYVTATKKTFFAACFSDSIFNQRSKAKNVFTSTTSDALLKNSDRNDAQLESKTKASNLPDKMTSISGEGHCSLHTESEEPNWDVRQTQAVVKTMPTGRPSEETQPHSKRPSVKTTASRTLQYQNVGVTTRSATCAHNCCTSPVQYTSPIRLMFVSPVKNKDGIVYSLKSARSGSNAQAEEEPFDPYKESSWAGTPEKKQSQMTECATPHIRPTDKSTTSSLQYVGPSTKSSPSRRTKSGSSPAKQALSTPRSASPPKLGSSSVKLFSSSPESTATPRKSGSSSAESASAPFMRCSSPATSLSSSPKITPGKCTPSPKSTSPKIGSKRSGEVTPPKNPFGMASQSPGDLQSFHEITPLKRRPGRPKKLGPHLEQKAKRPIGRPRKQKPEHAATGTNAANVSADPEENVNKNLKITVVYGRSRRNKRMVSESFDQLQTEFRDACRAVGLKNNANRTQNSKINTGHLKMVSPEFPEGLHSAHHVKEAPQHPNSKIKCQKGEKALPLRKPGRPAKVKISGISVTVTTVSPKQRKILIEKDAPAPQKNRKALLTDFQSAKESKTVTCQSVGHNLQPEEQRQSESKPRNKVLNQPLAVRHSKRVSKPSIYFLHAVATSTTRAYCHSNALLRRSKQLLLSKACNKRKQEKETRGEHSIVKRHRCEQERKNISQALARAAGVSLDSIFAPEETLRWWAASAEQETLNQALARRIQLMSDTWVSDAVENRRVDLRFKVDAEGTGSSVAKSKHSSVVQSLFNCPPSRPRSCSMQQLGSWFMETTETQSLAIVKRTSARNRYEVMHFPRSASKHGVKCQSPQAERLRRHLKKFAKTLPKSPAQHEKAQKRLTKMKEDQSIRNIRQRLFSRKSKRGVPSRGASRWQYLSKYQAARLRAKSRFLTRQERKCAKKERKTQITARGPELAIGIKPKLEALKPVKDEFSQCSENSSKDQSEEPVGTPKEQNIRSKAWNPESLKECRVFLKKINSPDNISAEEWNCCTVTLDKSASAFVIARKNRQLVEVVKAVKRKGHANGLAASTKLIDSACESLQELDEMPLGRQNGKCPSLVSVEPPPAKKLRQSRMKGLSGPRWCDFVLGS
ncbi:uncharacterized protein lcorl isoform X3 [Hippocampus zosterae]|uniref:uncharacterized protein lcorl isoform X3 n=1 Tax=Hippocampus zosterae TaxID=109293 RepID=UPI00223D7FFB|nr:uncharacterized protein lcorl isoform X3 [Hippocampus zosterae]